MAAICVEDLDRLRRLVDRGDGDDRAFAERWSASDGSRTLDLRERAALRGLHAHVRATARTAHAALRASLARMPRDARRARFDGAGDHFVDPPPRPRGRGSPRSWLHVYARR